MYFGNAVVEHSFLSTNAMNVDSVPQHYFLEIPAYTVLEIFPFITLGIQNSDGSFSLNIDRGESPIEFLVFNGIFEPLNNTLVFYRTFNFF